MKTKSSEYVLMVRLGGKPHLIRRYWFDPDTKSIHKSLKDAKEALALNRIAQLYDSEKFEMWIDFIKRETKTTRIKI